jgi:hypothetical protein
VDTEDNGAVKVREEVSQLVLIILNKCYNNRSLSTLTYASSWVEPTLQHLFPRHPLPRRDSPLQQAYPSDELLPPDSQLISSTSPTPFLLKPSMSKINDETYAYFVSFMKYSA